MKKTILILISMILVLITGCFNKNKDVIKTFKDEVENMKSYRINGTLEIMNNENSYTYDAKILYKKNDKFKVDLKNKTNEHQQIILKNEDGVYVKTQKSTKQKLNVI